MVKARCVVITAQVDMNFIVVCERIMELQPSKKMNMMMMTSKKMKKPVASQEIESLVCIVLMREATPIPC